MAIVKIDEYSLATVPIEMMFNEVELSTATAFIWKAENGTYWLITNWHNLSGRDANTGKHLLDTLAEPNKLRVLFNLTGEKGTKFTKSIDIHNATGTPLWLVHPTYGRRVDVVALQLSALDDVEMYAINTLRKADDLALGVGMDVFVLGYPFGAGSTGLPIWKRGSIASEPELAGETHGLHFLVDTASRHGMSGSPVIRRSWGTQLKVRGDVATGTATRLVGVYSGRLATKDPRDIQLGLTWPERFIPEIIAGGQVDSSA